MPVSKPKADELADLTGWLLRRRDDLQQLLKDCSDIHSKGTLQNSVRVCLRSAELDLAHVCSELRVELSKPPE